MYHVQEYLSNPEYILELKGSQDRSWIKSNETFVLNSQIFEKKLYGYKSYKLSICKKKNLGPQNFKFSLYSIINLEISRPVLKIGKLSRNLWTFSMYIAKASYSFVSKPSIK